MLHFTRPALLALMAIVVLAALVSCGNPAGPPDAQSPLRIVSTTGMIADAARAVAGDKAEVAALMGAGVDPHLYKPTRSDMAQISEAGIVFYNGLHLEGKMIDALVRAATSGRKVFAVTESLDESVLLEPPGFDGNYDPHVWMDPVAWSRAVEVVRDKLIENDSANADQYTANAAAYLAELTALHDYAERVLNSVPESSRVLVTAHDAFNYFGRRYGFEVVGIQGISTESEAGVRDIEAIIDLLVERRIGAVFVETTVAQRNIEALIAGAERQDHTVLIGGSLYSDAMGAAGSYEGSYIGMIDHNVTTIARALGGEAPARGMNGRLSAGDTQ